MPRTAPAVKRAAVAGYGAEIRLCEPTLAAREAKLAEIVEETRAVFVPPYDDPRIIAGQGTATLELLEQVGDLNCLIGPVGGGGLMSGACLAASADPRIDVYGAEPKGADDAYRSLQAGRRLPADSPNSIADGLLTSLSDLTFGILQRHLDDIVTVSEEQIVDAMRLIWTRMKLVVEPSAAVPLAAVLQRKEPFAGMRVGLILSGGNVDLDHLPWAGQRPTSETA